MSRHDSIRRALNAALEQGIIRGWQEVTPPKAWCLTLPSAAGHTHYTTREVEAFCEGIASARITRTETP